MATQRITLVPDPPVQGEQVVICYDFDESGLTSTTLTVTFDVDEPIPSEVSLQHPCVTIDVPDDATAITVVDASRVSADKTGPVSPP